jgi:hypothetical protein
MKSLHQWAVIMVGSQVLGVLHPHFHHSLHFSTFSSVSFAFPLYPEDPNFFMTRQLEQTLEHRICVAKRLDAS